MMPIRPSCVREKSAAVVLLLDNSRYGSNEDFLPRRFPSQQQAATLLATMYEGSWVSVGGSASELPLFSPFVADREQAKRAVADVTMQGDTCDLLAALCVARMALRRFVATLPRGEATAVQQRIILFVGSPIRIDAREWRDAGLSGFALDVLTFGEDNRAALSRLPAAMPDVPFTVSHLSPPSLPLSLLQQPLVAGADINPYVLWQKALGPLAPLKGPAMSPQQIEADAAAAEEQNRAKEAALAARNRDAGVPAAGELRAGQGLVGAGPALFIEVCSPTTGRRRRLQCPLPPSLAHMGAHSHSVDYSGAMADLAELNGAAESAADSGADNEHQSDAFSIVMGRNSRASVRAGQLAFRAGRMTATRRAGKLIVSVDDDRKGTVQIARAASGQLHWTWSDAGGAVGDDFAIGAHCEATAVPAQPGVVCLHDRTEGRRDFYWLQSGGDAAALSARINAIIDAPPQGPPARMAQMLQDIVDAEMDKGDKEGNVDAVGAEGSGNRRRCNICHSQSHFTWQCRPN